ncbi:hypothetical protein CDL15_Pgr009522 [Punica granatum]|uniref:Uncharacterized protein n=1 Tax=Punica granatum TaxID=22663 RepID=A0A218WTM7_PUNGR|nr:hypothetical protein CDL15_Pgr009522 [Punica granatum]
MKRYFTCYSAAKLQLQPGPLGHPSLQWCHLPSRPLGLGPSASCVTPLQPPLRPYSQPATVETPPLVAAARTMYQHPPKLRDDTQHSQRKPLTRYYTKSRFKFLQQQNSPQSEAHTHRRMIQHEQGIKVGSLILDQFHETKDKLSSGRELCTRTNYQIHSPVSFSYNRNVPLNKLLLASYIFFLVQILYHQAIVKVYAFTMVTEYQQERTRNKSSSSQREETDYKRQKPFSRIAAIELIKLQSSTHKNRSYTIPIKEELNLVQGEEPCLRKSRKGTPDNYSIHAI